MGFLQPLALLGLVAVGIPPLLHLLDRRRPPVVRFPAVRYLEATEREHSRRLRLRNLLLLLLRMAVILAVVLAASRPVFTWDRGRGHEPTAIGLVLDNSPSAGAVVGGASHWTRLSDVGRSVVARLGAEDVLRVVTADGVVERSTPAAALALLDTLRPASTRLDLVAAVTTLDASLAQVSIPRREIIVLSDGQASALSGSVEGTTSTVLALQPAPPVRNRGIDSVRVERGAGAQSHRVAATVGGEGERTAVEVRGGERAAARSIVGPGETAVLDVTWPAGWHAAVVTLDPDELRVDDERWIAVSVGPPPAAAAGRDAGTYAAEAVRVLVASGRFRDGGDVRLDGAVGDGAALVVPPSDPALVGVVNRDLAARGVSWQFGPLIDGQWIVETDVPGLDGAAVSTFRRLEGDGVVLARVGGAPWLVRAGDVVIAASRFDPAWTDVPVRAGFLPFLDHVVTQLAGGMGWVVATHPGAEIRVPSGGTTLVLDGDERPLAADRRLRAPARPGVHFVRAADGDTVGALQVNVDPRESQLRGADRRTVAATLGPRARVLEVDELERELFAGARRAEAATGLLVAALLLGVLELAVATFGGRTRTA